MAKSIFGLPSTFNEGSVGNDFNVSISSNFDEINGWVAALVNFQGGAQEIRITENNPKKKRRPSFSGPFFYAFGLFSIESCRISKKSTAKSQSQ